MTPHSWRLLVLSVVVTSALSACQRSPERYSGSTEVRPSASSERSHANDRATPGHPVSELVPQCPDGGTQLKLLIQGEGPGVVLAPETSRLGRPCATAGLALQVSVRDATGLLHISGNPAELQLGGESNGRNVVFWSNWCGRTGGTATFTAKLGVGAGLATSTQSPYWPSCISDRAPSTLQAILN